LKTIDYKIPGGKMLKIKVNLEGKVIQSIAILGDFFLHPESTLDEIEERVVGCTVSIELVTSEIQKVLDKNDAVLIGASALDIARAIEKAANS
jgi:lipoate-protein ligase A